MEKMRRKTKDLNSWMEGLELKLKEEIAERFKKKEPNPEVQNWFRRVESAILNIEAVQQKYGNVTCCSCACLGKHILNIIEEVDQLHQNGALLYNLGSLVVDVRSD